MEQLQIQTAHNVAIELDVAGVGDRIIAALYDYLILGAYAVTVSLTFVAHRSEALLTLSLLPAALYFLLAEVFMSGQSLGKQAHGLRVVRLDGAAPSLGSYLLRWLLRPIDVTFTLGNVAIISLLVTGRGQRLGDLAAGTTVVRVQPRAELAPARAQDGEHAVTFEEADRLRGEDVELAREVLDAYHYEGRTARSLELAASMKDVLEEQLGVRSDLPPPQFLLTVLRDYRALHAAPPASTDEERFG